MLPRLIFGEEAFAFLNVGQSHHGLKFKALPVGLQVALLSTEREPEPGLGKIPIDTDPGGAGARCLGLADGRCGYPRDAAGFCSGAGGSISVHLRLA